MPLSTILKRLRLKMASMQSTRTQCCCCAIGVFAAMFGIFMLSAGICIVLNVTFMEVDTSGLPPELHNDDGKKVVGIILICVAIAALGLSATVSVVYFAFCNKKPTPFSTANHNHHQNHSHGHRANPNFSNRASGSTTLPIDRQCSTPERPTSRDSVKSAGQTSLNSSRARRISPPVATVDGVPFSRTVVPPGQGRPPKSGPRTQPPGHRGYKNRHKPRHIRPSRGRYQSNLDPHIEEESEAAKSVMDLQQLHKSGDTSSNSGSSLTYSRQSTSVDDGGGVNGGGATAASSSSRTVPPAIVIDSYPNKSSTPMSTMSSMDAFMETQFTDTGPLYEEDTLTGTYDEESLGRSDRRESQGSQFHDASGLDSASLVNEFDSQHEYSYDPYQFSSVSRRESRESDLDPPPSLPYNIDVVDDNNSTDFVMTSTPPIHPPSGQNLFHDNIVRVKPLNGYDLETPGSSSHTLDFGLDQEEKDRLPDLPSIPRQQQVALNVLNDNADLDNRCESRSSYNSAFSYDGDDPEKTDMERLQEKMEKLLESDRESVKS